MKTVNTYTWRIQGIKGRWHTTRYHSTEENIKEQHPEAICNETSLIAREVYESGDEVPNTHPPFPWHAEDSPYVPGPPKLK